MSTRRSDSTVQEADSQNVVSATEAQNNFGRVLARAMAGGTVYITKHDRPAAAVVSIDRYHDLAGTDDPDLVELEREFDVRLAHMQSDKAAAAFDALFRMGSEDLGRAAVRGARRKRD